MRILNLCVESDDIMGGRGEMNVQVMRRLHSLGHEVHHVVLYDRWIEPPAYAWSKATGPWPYVPFEQTAIGAQVMHSLVLHCLKLRKEFDIILAHDWDMMFCAAELSQIWGIPWVAYFHLFQHQMLAVEKRTNLSDAAVMPVAYEWFGLLHSDRAVCVSQNMADYAFDSMPTKEKPAVIHNGVEEVPTASYRAPGVRPKILFIGRIATQKGYWFFLDAAEAMPHCDFIFAGKHAALKAEDAEETEEMKRIRQMESLPNFKYLGHIDRTERDKLYQEVDIVVMPSIAEPFGIVALEAQAHGKPIITTLIDGIPEFLSEGNSWKCEPSSQSVIETVQTVLDNPKEAERRALNGLSNVKQFSWDKTAQKVEQLIKDTIYDFRSPNQGTETKTDTCLHNA